MFKFTKKSIIHFGLTAVLAFGFAQCAWTIPDHNFNKLALQADGISVFGNDNKSSLYVGDDEEYIIDANSPEAASVPSTTRLTGNIQIAGAGKKVSVSLRDADVKQVLRMFADKANMNIIFHNSVEGTVTLDLKDVTINSALEFVLDSCELTYIRQDNNIIIASKEAAKDLSYARQNFTIIPVKYVNAQAVANFLNKSMFNGKYQGVSAKPVVAVNASKNELMVFGTEEDEKLVSKILEKLDTKPMLNVFPVNHITPKEMAATICDTILSDKSEGGAQNGVSPSSDTRGGGDDEISLGGGYTVCVVGENNGTVDKGDEGEDLSNYASNPLIVAYFPEHGTVALYGGSREQVKMIESFIKLHDKKQPMAYIELSLIQLSETGMKDFSNAWTVWTPFATFKFDSAGLRTDPFGPIFWRGEEFVLKESFDDEGDKYVKNSAQGFKSVSPIVMTLNYLVQNGKGRVLANPKIMVTNGKKSTINLTSDYVESTSKQIAEGYLNTVEAITYNINSDNGIQMDIVPFISPDGYVVLKINPDYSTIKEQHTDSTGNMYTLLTHRSVELENVRVKDGETLVLAGLVQEDERQSVTKLPILGDLPLVGPLFRNTTTTKAKEEMVILITPHIVYSKEQIEHLKKMDNENL